VGETLCRQWSVIPVRTNGDRVFIASSQLDNTEAIEALTQKCKRIGLLSASQSEIERQVHERFDALSETAAYAQAFELADDSTVADNDHRAAVVDENAPIVQVVSRIVTQGVRNRASDIHIEAHQHAVKVRYRIDGALSEALTLPAKMGPAIASRIKVMAELNIVERRRPQDGQFSLKVDGRPIDIRTSVLSTIHGEKVVMRVLDKTRSIIGLTQLGMPTDTVTRYLSIVNAPVGMLLCTGPTGSGKTTTLYSTLAEVDDPKKNVITIEDPVEYEFDGINQMQVSEAAGITFADGLRGVLRQDPDVILVGEIRDQETARIATQAALTGHFVLSSLHAVDAVAAVHRFIDMGIEPFLVASAISGVIGQRLLRKICSSCRIPHEPSSRDYRVVRSVVGNDPVLWMRGAGCPACNDSGYHGRQGVYELLQMSDRLRELIVSKASHAEMRHMAIEDGMQTMQDQAFRLVAKGVTTVEEVLRAVYAPGVEVADARPILALGAGRASLHVAEQGAAEPSRLTGRSSEGSAGSADADLTVGETA
jgi:type IV pilus assembly protein PilB